MTKYNRSASEVGATFFYKKPFDGRTQYQQLIVKEHIANELYLLFGVTTPPLYFVQSKQDNPALVSKKLKRYIDFSDFIGGENFFKKLYAIESDNRIETVNQRVEFFQEQLTKKHITLIGRESLLLASILLKDFDVLGRNLDNIGVVPTIRPKTYCLVKIDPGNANFKADFKSFKDEVSAENPLVTEDYSSITLNYGANILGPMHYMEFFASLDKTKFLNALSLIAAISDDEIGKIVYRQEYLAYVEKPYLDMIYTTVIERKAHLLSEYPDIKPYYKRMLESADFYRPITDFFITDEKKINGASKPRVAYETSEYQGPKREVVSLI